MTESLKAMVESALAKIVVPESAIIQEGTMELRAHFDANGAEIYNVLLASMDTSNPLEIRQLVAVVLSNKLDRKQAWDELPKDGQLNVQFLMSYMYWSETELNSMVENSLLELLLRTTVDFVFKPDECSPEIMQVLESIKDKLSKGGDLNYYRKALKAFNQIVVLYTVLDDTLCMDVFRLIMKFFSSHNVSENVNNQNQQYLELMPEVLSAMRLVASHPQLCDMLQVEKLVMKMYSYAEAFMSAGDDERLGTVLAGICEMIVMAVDSMGNENDRKIVSIIKTSISILRDGRFSFDTKTRAMEVLEKCCQVQGPDVNAVVDSVFYNAYELLMQGFESGVAEIGPVFEYESIHSECLLPLAISHFRQLADLCRRKAIFNLMVRILPQNAGMTRRGSTFLLLGLSMESVGDFIDGNEAHLLDVILEFRCDADPSVKAVGLFALVEYSRLAKIDFLIERSREIIPLLIDHLTLICETAGKNWEDFKPAALRRLVMALNKLVPCTAMQLYLPRLVHYLLENSFKTSYGMSNMSVGTLSLLRNFGFFAPHLGAMLNSLRRYHDSKPENQPGFHYEHWIQLMQAIVQNHVLTLALGQEILNICKVASNAADSSLKIEGYKLMSGLSKSEELMNLRWRDLDAMIQNMLKDLNVSDSSIPGNSFDVNYRRSLHWFYHAKPDISMDSEEEENSRCQDPIHAENKIKIIDCLLKITANVPLLYRKYLKTTVSILESLHFSGDKGLQESVVHAYCQFQFHAYQVFNGTDLKTIQEDVGRMAGEYLNWWEDNFPTYTDDDLLLLTAVIEYFVQAFKYFGKPMLEMFPALTARVTSLVNELANDDRTYFTYNSNTFESDEEEDEYDQFKARQNLQAGFVDLIQYFSRAVSNAEFVGIIFPNIFPGFRDRLEHGENDHDKMFILSAIAESMKQVTFHGGGYFNECVSLLVKWTDDENEVIRNNSIYGLGEIAYESKRENETVVEVIQPLLLERILLETDAKVMDNIVAALAKLILTHLSEVDIIRHVLSEMFKQLPLKVDPMENRILFTCFRFLFLVNQSCILPYLDKIVPMAAHILLNKSKLDHEGYGVDSERVLLAVASFIKHVSKSDSSARFESIVENMDNASITALFSASRL